MNNSVAKLISSKVFIYSEICMSLSLSLYCRFLVHCQCSQIHYILKLKCFSDVPKKLFTQVAFKICSLVFLTEKTYSFIDHFQSLFLFVPQESHSQAVGFTCFDTCYYFLVLVGTLSIVCFD